MNSRSSRLGVVGHAFNSREAESGRSLAFEASLVYKRELQENQGYTEKFCLEIPSPIKENRVLKDNFKTRSPYESKHFLKVWLISHTICSAIYFPIDVMTLLLFMAELDLCIYTTFSLSIHLSLGI